MQIAHSLNSSGHFSILQMTYAISTMIERLSKQKPKHVCGLSHRDNFWLNKYTDNRISTRKYMLDSCCYKYITKMCAKSLEI